MPGAMELIPYLISLVFTGLVVGALGRLLLPGRDPMSIPATIGVGLLATLVSGLVLSALVGRGAGSLLLSVLVAVGIVAFIRRGRRDRHARRPGPRSPFFGGRSARDL
jgi:uncharacterized membrane protein YeaQ/YmgE (transglycosylase-associated protein family)